jgi:hypothetical protein
MKHEIGFSNDDVALKKLKSMKQSISNWFFL